MGFKSDHFVKKVDENLQCAICHDVFDNPSTCKDGHTFCSECIEKWLKRKTKCPADNRPLNKKALVRNLTVKGIIDNMDVYCDPSCTQKIESRPAKRIKKEKGPSDVQNCCWIGKLHELEVHRKSCGFQLVSCTYENCKQQMKRKELEEHEETCKYKKVICKECASHVVECKLQKHLEKNCPNAMVPCKKNCSTDGVVTKIRRIDIADHLSSVCPKVRVDCPYKEQGCVVKVERQHVDKHVQENVAAHMMLLAKECSSLKNQNQSLTDQCTSLVHKNEQLNKELSEVKNKELSEVKARGILFEEEFHSQLSSICSYTWTVSDYPNLCKNHPNGSSIKSPPFWLRGHKWYILVYPNGDRTADATRFLSLYLRKVEVDTMFNTSRNESAIPFRLTVISQKPGTDDVYNETKRVFAKDNHGLGWAKFMKSSDALSPSYCSDGRLIIQCTILPDKPK